MKISYTRMQLFQSCPLKYYERYVRGVEPDREQLGWESDSLELGRRVHELLEERYLPGREPYPASTNERIEAEAQLILAAYRLEYPEEPFEIIEVERAFEVPLPDSPHVLTGKFDAIIRENGQLKIFETKTQKRGSLRNLPTAWAMRSQVSLYLWAAHQLYGERPSNILLNVITRPSEKRQLGPEFRRDYLERTEEQMAEAVASITWVASQIEALELTHTARGLPWPSNRDVCADGWYKCDYYDLHLLGDTPEVLARFKFTPERLAHDEPKEGQTPP